MKTFVLVPLLFSITNAQGLSGTVIAVSGSESLSFTTTPHISSTPGTSTISLTLSESTRDISITSLAVLSPVVTTRAIVTVVVGASSSTSSSQPTQSAPPQSASGGGLSMGSIIGLSMAGGVVVIGLIIAFFIWKLKRKHFSDFDNGEAKKWPDLNTHGGVTALREMSNTVPSPDVVNPFTGPPSNPTFTFLRQNYTSNGQSLPFQSIPNSKFSHGNQPSETPLQPQFSSPAFISSSSHGLPLSGSQANLDSTSPRVPQVTTEPSIQRSPPSPQLEGATARFGFVRHEDSGVRISLARNNFVELPPLYTPG